MRIKGIQSIKKDRIYWKNIDEEALQTTSVSNGEIELFPDRKYQQIIGFGGAFTEAAAYVFSKLNVSLQEEILHAYFHEDGNAYNLGRVHINSCDFSLQNYTYVKENDKTLQTFSLEHEKTYVIPFLKKAQQKAQARIRLIASPWSPPAYMKDNHCMNQGGKLLNQYAPRWASYYVRYIEEMKKNGITIDALTTQNEPAASQKWDSCLYSPEEERDFIRDHLGPTLQRSNLSDIHLYIWDHNRGDVLLKQARCILNDPEAASYVHGLAFHWYCSEDFNSLQQFHMEFPDKALLFTEGCVEYGVYGDESKSRWENGEHYAHHMIQDFLHFSQGFIDWNLILDLEGGPNHVGNFCEAPVMCDLQNQRLIYNTSYYYIGHFSRYVHPNARRIGMVMKNLEDTIEAVAFINEDQEVVLIILNRGSACQVRIRQKDDHCQLTLPEHSITTLQLR